ncbi:MAG: HNH endonuclease [Planctomycetota bacterium]|nr:HNH endonuclease [Planctomycetota bacterium]
MAMQARMTPAAIIGNSGKQPGSEIEKINAVIIKAGKAGCTAAEVVEACGANEGLIRSHFNTLHSKGLLVKLNRGRYAVAKSATNGDDFNAPEVGEYDANTQLVERWEQVEANIRTLEAARRSEAAQLREEYGALITKGRHFIAYQSESGVAFAPSKFIGYIDNDIATHRNLRSNGRNGRETSKALKRILGGAPEADESAEKAYLNFCGTLGTPDEHARKYWITDKVIQTSAVHELNLPDWTPPPEITSTITRKIRDTATTKRLKSLYDYKCMVCGIRLGLSGGKGYAECGHIRPIGGPQPGPDEPENILVLCPNHHVMLDAGLLGIDPGTLKIRLAPRAEPADLIQTRLRLCKGHTLRVVLTM